MTSWRSVTQVFFLVSLSIFHPSKQEEFCKTHYFSMKELRKHLFPDEALPDIMPIVETKDPKDMVECTVERAYVQNRSSMELKYLLQCITNNAVGEDYSESKKCQGDHSKYIPYFNFMCLVAKAVKAPPEELDDRGCEKELSCPVSHTATTTVQPTTTPERTTSHPTEMRSPSLQQPTTTQTTTQTTTGAAAALSQSPPTPSNGKKDKIESDKPDNFPAQVGSLTTLLLLLLSVCTNVGLVAYICVSHRRRQYGPWPISGTNELNPTLPGDQPSSILLPSVNGESVETLPLYRPHIQPSDGHPV